MSSLQNEARLFGLDLAPLGRDLLTAWSGMLEWPFVSWLWPRLSVCVWMPKGQKAFSHGPQTTLIFDADKAARAKFQALVLPEDILLRRSFDMPNLAQSELEAAIDLQLQAFSPFSEQECVWTYESHLGENGQNTQVHAVLTSHKLIADHIALAYPGVESQSFEVWVPQVQGEQYILVPGFAETRRQSRSNAWRWASAVMVILALALVAAILITPSVKLHLRAQQAEMALKTLQEKAIPVLSEREGFSKATEKIASLKEMFGNTLPPLQILQLVTDALNDDASLLSLQIQGNKVNITGQAQNAALLMKQLDATPGIRDVKAPAPATKPLGALRETFTIEFVIDPEQLPQPANALAAQPADAVAAPVSPLAAPVPPVKKP
jgi:general secretion pathway protein L